MATNTNNVHNLFLLVFASNHWQRFLLNFFFLDPIKPLLSKMGTKSQPLCIRSIKVQIGWWQMEFNFKETVAYIILGSSFAAWPYRENYRRRAGVSLEKMSKHMQGNAWPNSFQKSQEVDFFVTLWKPIFIHLWHRQSIDNCWTFAGGKRANKQ